MPQFFKVNFEEVGVGRFMQHTSEKYGIQLFIINQRKKNIASISIQDLYNLGINTDTILFYLFILHIFNESGYFLRYNELKKIDNELQRALEKLQQDLDLLMTQKMAFEEELNMSQVFIYLF